MKKVLALVLLLAVLFVLAGCDRKEPSVSLIPNLDEDEDSVITDEKTPYRVLADDGESIVVYYKENHPEVIAVKEVVERYHELVVTRDYRTITGDEAYETYTQDMIDWLEEKNDKESTVEFYKANELVMEALGIEEYLEFDFSANAEECIVSFVSLAKAIHVSGEMAEEMTAGKTYGVIVKLQLIKQADGKWLIDNYGKGSFWEEE
jgi:predicted small lipoprotein YifL